MNEDLWTLKLSLELKINRKILIPWFIQLWYMKWSPEFKRNGKEGKQIAVVWEYIETQSKEKGRDEKDSEKAKD